LQPGIELAYVRHSFGVALARRFLGSRKKGPQQERTQDNSKMPPKIWPKAVKAITRGEMGEFH